MLSNYVEKLDAVLFTHEHKDHVAGMDDIRSFNFLQKKDMPIYAEAATLEVIKREFPYVFSEDRYPGVPRLDLHQIDTNTFDAAGIPIIPIRGMHGKMEILGFRTQDFTYITDASYIAPEEREKVRRSKVLVVNALRIKEHYSHFNLAQALELIEDVKPERAYLTHMSHDIGLHAKLKQLLPHNVFPAYDGLTIEV